MKLTRSGVISQSVHTLKDAWPAGCSLVRGIVLGHLGNLRVSQVKSDLLAKHSKFDKYKNAGGQFEGTVINVIACSVEMFWVNVFFGA